MAGVVFDKFARDAICEVRFKRRAGADAVVQALNALCEKKYPERGSYTVIMHREEKKDKGGEYSIGLVLGSG